MGDYDRNTDGLDLVHKFANQVKNRLCKLLKIP